MGGASAVSGKAPANGLAANVAPCGCLNSFSRRLPLGANVRNLPLKQRNLEIGMAVVQLLNSGQISRGDFNNIMYELGMTPREFASNPAAGGARVMALASGSV